MRLPALLVAAVVATACVGVSPTESVAPGAPTAEDGLHTRAPVRTAAPGNKTQNSPVPTTVGSSPTLPSMTPAAPPPVGVRACDYDPLLSEPAEMPPEVSAYVPDPIVVEQPANTPVDPATTQRQLGVFEELVDIVDEAYIYIDLEGFDWAALVARYDALIRAGLTDEDFYLAMDNLIVELGDEHSDFEDPQEVIEIDQETSGTSSYVGVGVLLQPLPDADRSVVILTYPGGSAAEAGVKAHDAVLRVDGQPILDEDGELRIDRVRGPEGSEVTLTVQTPGRNPYDVTLERRSVSSAMPVDFCMVPRTRVGYIFLPTLFDETIPQQMRDALGLLTGTGAVDGLILDNRQNGGGFSTVAEDVLAPFTDGLQGHFVNRDERRPLRISGTEIGDSQTVPLVVLVDLETASFGEIVSGVLQHSGRAQVAGQNTLGNVEVLWTYTLEDGSRAVIAHDAFQPTGLDIGVWEEEGIVPDAIVPTRWDLFTEATDPAFPVALGLLADQGVPVPDPLSP